MCVHGIGWTKNFSRSLEPSWSQTMHEVSNQMKQQVWCNIKQDKIPERRHCVKCHWVFKIKRKEIFCACLVACGYSQIPGVDFSENYSPVVHHVTFRILILLLMAFGLKAKIVDVETVILYGTIEEGLLHMCLDTYHHTHCLLLSNCQ